MLDRYMHEIASEPLLSAAEESSLALRMRRGDAAARERMIKANLRLVVTIACEFAGRGVPLPDLVSEGNLGLIKAVDRFRPQSGAKLSTYASWWIREAVHRCLCTHSRVVRLPMQMVSKIVKLRRASAMLSEELGRDPVASELAEELGIPVSSVRQCESAAHANLSLDEPVCEAGLPFAATLADDKTCSADSEVFAAERRAEVRALLEAVGPRERKVLERRFGLAGHDGCTLHDLAIELGCTRERVRQIQAQALRKMRRECSRREALARLDCPPA